MVRADQPTLSPSGLIQVQNDITTIDWRNHRDDSGAATQSHSWQTDDIPIEPGTNVIPIHVRAAFWPSSINLTIPLLK